MINLHNSTLPSTFSPRKKQSGKGQSLPKEFIQKVGNLFNTQFQESRQRASFSLYGAIYPDEVLFGISLMESGRLRSASAYFSKDLDDSVREKPEKLTNCLTTMVDLSSSWISQCYEDQPDKKGTEALLIAIDSMSAGWQEVNWEGSKVFISVDKTNQTLEQAADKILEKE